ncbi:hypothetical protein O6H91_06G079100 [Diphasiastrum complanatum]|uniref:Uncharacterized protein n=1 Tax=Diphasiastrum complanatum TaxID=34168 RepID=A0ACC2DFD3_DIPCM|nr:hypothetical protein O6H91_06G079100 [Diphasiastrum complanatum]
MGVAIDYLLLRALFATIILFGVAHGAKPIFVFGDSYVDTGNRNYSEAPWRNPYGITWPGHPSGRFSNGLLLTDFVAKAMKSKSPTPYRFYTKYSRSLRDVVKHGLNFGVGGSGVFQAFDPRNFSVQVDQLKGVLQTIPQQLFPLEHTPVLVSFVGNDYRYYLATNGTLKELPVYITKVVTEVTRNIIRLYGLGLKRFVVGNIEPLGCVPSLTASVSYKRCLTTYDPLVQFHNQLLAQQLNATFTALKGADYFILDQYKAFQSVIANPSPFGIKHRLRPCCTPKPGNIDSCGEVDKNGEPLYEVCSSPETHFFWDGLHPTQAGWTALTSSSFVGGNSPHNKSANLATWLQNEPTS